MFKFFLYEWGGLNSALIQVINRNLPPILIPWAWFFSNLLGKYWGAPLMLFVSKVFNYPIAIAGLPRSLAAMKGLAHIIECAKLAGLSTALAPKALIVSKAGNNDRQNGKLRNNALH